MTKTIVIAEKPELGKAIAAALGGGTRANGYLDCGEYLVTWAFGHMLEFEEPQATAWTWDTLPLKTDYRKVPSKGKSDQLKVIKSLLKGATGVVHAGDPDTEGQLIVDEILLWAGSKLPVQRLLVNDLNQAIVKKALAAMKPNAEYAGMSQAAEARSRGDFAYGLNLTRAYTLAGRAKGHDGVLSVGRVQTPILGLVVRRCRAFAGHAKSVYYVLGADVQVSGVAFRAVYQITESDAVDEGGRLNDKAAADALALACSGKPAIVTLAKTDDRQQPPPLPYNLLALQAAASQRHGLKPDAVKDLTQSLREKHRLITYNRSDSQYLSDEQHADAGDVLGAIGANVEELKGLIAGSDATLKSRAFNSAKVTAHHAIIPTATRADLAALSAPERVIYVMIAKAYALQFLPSRRYKQTKVVIEVDGAKFEANAARTTFAGWTSADDGLREDDVSDSDEERVAADITGLSVGDLGSCVAASALAKETKPQPLYTVATLLKKLTRVADEIKNPQLRKILVAKDAAKEGENGGIGTPATRDTMIATLLDRGFMEEKGKTIVATKLGFSFYDALPDNAKFPDMTAFWHAQQESVASGGLSLAAFVEGIETYVAKEIGAVREAGVNIATNAPPCPLCGHALRRIKGAKGFFWSCSGREAGCAFTADDKNGKPVARTPSQGVKSATEVCSDCGAPLVRRPSTRVKGQFWWSCSGYPVCKASYPDKDGRAVTKLERFAVSMKRSHRAGSSWRIPGV